MIEDATPCHSYLQSLRADLYGHNPELKLNTGAPGTNFQRRVWAVLCQIPRCAPRSPAKLTRMIGVPEAVLAVATVCARNPAGLAAPWQEKTLIRIQP
ncbi:MGMT family protein [Deinococcus saxicola]|uniref:MGMT family protein n=1 Tax=Deinococcus saxicola TaxID=249406 RepID=UPI0039EFE5DE